MVFTIAISNLLLLIAKMFLDRYFLADRFKRTASPFSLISLLLFLHSRITCQEAAIFDWSGVLPHLRKVGPHFHNGTRADHQPAVI